MRLKFAALAVLGIGIVVGIACQVSNTPVSDPATATATPPVEALPDAAATPPAEPAPTGVQPELQTAPSAPRADGAACSEPSQCASGVCEGEGCGTDQGRCASKERPCTRDLVTYCGCDGKTFQNSGSCAGKRFAHRGACGDGAAK
jgi:hypothetical protein